MAAAPMLVSGARAPERSRAFPDQLAAYQATMRAFGSIVEALGDGRDLDALLHLIARSICELAGLGRCSLYLRDPETTLFHGQVAHPEGVNDERIKRLVAGVPADRFTQEIVDLKRPVVVANALDDPRPIRSAMRAWHVRSILGVPMILHDDVIGIMFLDNEGESQVFPPRLRELVATFADLAAVAISQARMTKELRRSVATVAKQNKLLRHAAVADERLANLVLEGADLSAIAAAVAELTGKPIWIHDAKHRRLAAAQPPTPEPASLPSLLDPVYVARPEVADGLAGVSTRGGLIGPLPGAGLHHRFLVVPVAVRDEEYGHLVIAEYGRRFSSLDTHIARRAATKVALELTIERRSRVAEADARLALAADLISDTFDRPSLERRARYLGIDPTAPRVLCLVAMDEAASRPPAAVEQLSCALSAAASGADVLAVGVVEGTVAMVQLDPEMPPGEAVSKTRRIVEHALAELDIPGTRVAISSRCRISDGCARAYEEARQVMTCITSFARDPRLRVLTAEELGAGRVLLAACDRAAVMRFAHDSLHALLVDEEATRDLLRTLQVFFDCSRSVRRSALMLGVHENTIRYRLARIECLTGLDVATSSEDQLTAQLALLVLRLEGRFVLGGASTNGSAAPAPRESLPGHAGLAGA